MRALLNYAHLRTLCAALLALALLLGVGAAAAESADREQLELYVGEVRVLQVGELRRIAIGNGKVLQASALDRGQLLLIPEAPGQSVLYLWTRDGAERHLSISVVPADASRMLSEVRAMLGDTPGVTPRIVGDKVVIEGSGVSEEQAVRIAEVAGRYPQIVNLISRVGLERMIEMDVRMVEIRRDAMKNLGVKWSGTAQGPSFGLIGDLQRSAAFGAGGAAAQAGLEVRSRIAPFASGLGTVSVGFKEYGVKFEVEPVASETGVIAAKIATEISAINFDVQVQDVPGLTKRRAETEVNLRENETLVIAGLLSEDASRSIDKVPGLGELPILGALFRSREFRNSKTELVVFITPRFVSPGSETQRAAAERSAEHVEQARERLQMAE